MSNNKETFSKTLSPLTLWGLGVGYVISGMFFGWSHGLIYGGVGGLAVATLLMIIMYFCFVFSYCELCSLAPDAGGVFVYADMAFGKKISFVAGILQTAEFVFAAPAIALAIAAYIDSYFSIDYPFIIAFSLYVIFTLINIKGINLSAKLELVFTLIAIATLLLFFALSISHFNGKFISKELTIDTPSQIFAAIPFAIWFFLGIEGLANVSEETINPQKSLSFGFISAMITLALLAFLTLGLSVGINGWQSVVYTTSGKTSDTPILLSVSSIINNESLTFKLLVIGGLFGFIASFHGLVLVASRALYKFCDKGHFLPFAAHLSKKYHTPKNALMINFFIGIAAIYSGKTDNLIIISCFAALCCYLLVTLSMIKLRIKNPEIARPFKAPFYPLIQIIAVIIISLSLLCMSYAFSSIALFFYLILAVLCAYEFFLANKINHT